MSKDPSDTLFPWETLKAIVGGWSAVDVPRLHVETRREAEAFLECYGFDYEVPKHREEMEELRAEAIAFIDEELLDEDESIPAEVREESDPRRLLLWVSDDSSARQMWACGVLRVAHTMAHCSSYFNERWGADIRAQILDRFEPHLGMTDDGLVLGSEPQIPLVDFEVKTTKSLRSVTMKLLHKVDNVAADVFDRVGVRFVTRERFDALLVVRYLRENNVIMFANIKPSRSRNTLIDLEWLQRHMRVLDGKVADGQMSASRRLEALREVVGRRPFPGEPHRTYNPYSAVSYHSIQFTCRQMIRVDDGVESIRFFFPYEVQVLDEESYELSRSGFASHQQYKARQREAVRERVLGPVLATRD